MLRLHGFGLGCRDLACRRVRARARGLSDAGRRVCSARALGRLGRGGRHRRDGVGKTRNITGTILLTEKDGRYTSAFDLDTAFASEAGPVHANVIGEGEGTVSGRTLAGTSHTQILIAGAPNVDTGMAFVPRTVGTRIVSTTKATLADDGTIAIEIESAPEAGESYAPTKTTLKGSYLGTGANSFST